MQRLLTATFFMISGLGAVGCAAPAEQAFPACDRTFPSYQRIRFTGFSEDQQLLSGELECSEVRSQIRRRIIVVDAVFVDEDLDRILSPALLDRKARQTVMQDRFG